MLILSLLALVEATSFPFEDYPAAALKHRLEGIVETEVSVDANGKVTDCRVTKSSGHMILDKTTCRLVSKRGQFKAAVGADGKPIPSTVKVPPVEWKVPG